MQVATKLKTVDEIKAELEEFRSKKEVEGESLCEKKDWYGLIYCGANGYCSIAVSSENGGTPLWLGKTDEFIPYLKKRGVNGENIASVLSALEDFRAEQKNQENPPKAKNKKPRVSKSQSCHSATKNPQPYISIPPQKLNRATFEDNAQILASQRLFFKKDQNLLALLESLVKRDIGTPTIRQELNEAGYNIPYRTVGRWVSQMRSKELLCQGSL